ncbi:MAG: TAXI family TRAP transporter solute-binding subunit [Bradymonadia bacterium]
MRIIIIALLAFGPLHSVSAQGQPQSQPQNQPAAKADTPEKKGPGTLKLCTGTHGNSYHRAGMAIAKALEGKVAVEVVETKGSWDNLEGIDAQPRRCDAIIAQDDAYTLYQFEKPDSTLTMERITTLYPESIHLLCNRKAGIDDVRQLRSSKHRILIMPFGSGTYITWKLFTRLNPFYARLPYAEASNEEALLKVVDGVQAQCMVMVSGARPKVLKTADAQFGDQLKLVRLRDKQLSRKVGRERRAVYAKSEVDEDVYDNLLDDDLDTTSVDAVLFISPEWKAKHSKEAQEITLALLKLLPDIRKDLQ